MWDELLTAGGGVICRRELGHLSAAIDRALRDGKLVSVLPGVYAHPADTADFGLRVRALMCWRRDAVLVGASAAKVSFWPELLISAVSFSSERRAPRQAGFVSAMRRIPPELVREVDGIRFTEPALTALDLGERVGAETIDVALRTRATTLALLRSALELTPGRPGNRVRRELVLDSRDEPWSAAERVLHRLLRAAGLTGWRANYRVLVDGRCYFLDVAFPKLRLAIEVDGRQYHGADAFENDRRRQNDLVLDGWQVLRFTWTMLVDEPGRVIAMIRRALGEQIDR